MKKVLLSSFALVLIALTSWAIATTTAAPMKAASELNLVDATHMIVNPSFDEGTNGWTVNTGEIEVKATSTGNPVVTAYNYQVNISQHITGLTPGTYILKVQACSRHKDGKTGITEYESQGSSTPNEAYIYANGEQKKIKYIYDETSTYDFASASGQSASSLTMSNGQQIPYNSENLSYAFESLGMYENELEFTVAENGAATIGIKNELSGSSYKPYIGYDNFRLYRIDNGETPTTPEEPTDPEEPTTPEGPTGPVELYNLNAPAGTLVPICMPYAVKSSYFGQVYQIGSIQDGKAYIVPVNEVATGVPCVVKSNGTSTIKKGDVTLNTSARPKTFSLWDNTVMQATSSFTGYTWTATDIYGTAIDVANLEYVEGDLTNLEFTASIENNAAARYWAQHPDYKAEDESCIKNYYQLSVYNSATRRDKPNPILVPVYTSTSSQTVTYWRKADKSDKKTVTVAKNTNVAEIYDDNFIPGTVYTYESTYNGAKGKFTVGGTLRMMNIGTNVVNMRDLGGKVGKDGKYVKYGKLYRSAEFKGSTYNISTDEKNQLVALGISAELDLRNTDGGTSRAWIPNLVNNDNYFYAQNSTIIANGPGRMYESSTINLLKNEFTFLVANLRKGRSVQFHCRIGADRTGLFAFLIQGLLGVSEADILRDYESTSFSSAGLRTKEDGDGDSAASNYKAKVPTFRKTASTFVGAFEKYFLETLKVSQTDIDEFRKIMLGDTPLPSDVEAEELQKMIDAKKSEISNLIEAINTKIAELEENVGTEPGKYTLDDPNGAIPAAEAEVSTAEALIANTATLEGLTEEVTKLTACLEALNGVTKTQIPVEEDEQEEIVKKKQELQTLINDITKQIDDFNIGEGPEQNTCQNPQVIEAVEAKVKAAQDIINKTNPAATYEELVAAYSALDKIRDTLSTVKLVSNAVLAEKTKVEDLIAAINNEIETLNNKIGEGLDKYTCEDISPIDAAAQEVEKAQNLLKGTYTLEDLQNEVKALEEKQEGLKNVVLVSNEETAKQKAIDEINGLIQGINDKLDDLKEQLGDGTEYTYSNPDAVKVAEEAVESAQALIENKDYSSKQLKEEAAKLNLAEISAALSDVTVVPVEQEPGDDEQKIADAIIKINGFIDNINDKLKDLKKYNEGTNLGQFTCTDKDGSIREAAAKEVAEAKKLLDNTSFTLPDLENEVTKLEECWNDLDGVTMTLNMPKKGDLFYLLSKKVNELGKTIYKALTLWPGRCSNSAIKKAYGEKPDWIMYDVTTNYSVFTINDRGNIEQVLPGDKSYNGYIFEIKDNDVVATQFDPNAKGSAENAEFTSTEDPEAVNIKVGDSALGEDGDDVTAVALGNTEEISNIVFLNYNGNPPVAGINDIKADVQAGNVFNIAGQRVSDDYQGIIIRDGKRILVK